MGHSRGIPNGVIEQWFERGGEGKRLETAMPPNDLQAFEAALALRSSAAPAECSTPPGTRGAMGLLKFARNAEP